MHPRIPSVPQPDSEPVLPADFTERLERSLHEADQSRRRRVFVHRVQPFLPLLLLLGPIVAWRLMVASPGGVHVAIDALTWLTFLLDVGVHLNASILHSLGLQALPVVVGGLLLVLVPALLLSSGRGKE